MEIWKPCREYEMYEVSNKGRIRNVNTGRIMKTNLDKKGYEQVTLRSSNKQHTELVHRLVADAFVDGDGEGLDIIHKNDKRLDNCAENLEYATRSEVLRNAYLRGTRIASKSNCVKIRVIETGEIFESIHECSRKLGLNISGICKCVNGAAYTCGGLHFERVE